MSEYDPEDDDAHDLCARDYAEAIERAEEAEAIVAAVEALCAEAMARPDRYATQSERRRLRHIRSAYVTIRAVIAEHRSEKP